MNNIERAIEIIEGEHDLYMGPIDAPSLVYAMNGAGLLAPDLPKPDIESLDGICFWGASTFSITAGQKHRPGFVAVQDSEPGGVLYMDPASSRALAYALLAAADHAEKEAQ